MDRHAKHVLPWEASSISVLSWLTLLLPWVLTRAGEILCRDQLPQPPSLTGMVASCVVIRAPELPKKMSDVLGNTREFKAGSMANEEGRRMILLCCQSKVDSTPGVCFWGSAIQAQPSGGVAY